jgi:deoxyadenosine/deoxycytidine kinase
LKEGAHIAVVGQIGAGKSTLVSALARELSAVPVLERFEESPFLRAFYRAPARWAFHHSLFFIEQSTGDQHNAQALGRTLVQERPVEEHWHVFIAEFHARGYLSDDEWTLLERLGGRLQQMLRPIDLVVYIDISPACALRRLSRRGRGDEDDVKLDYLLSLADRYSELLARWPDSQILRLNAEDYDFRAEEDIRVIAEKVRGYFGPGDHDANSVAGTARLGQGHARTTVRAD